MNKITLYTHNLIANETKVSYEKIYTGLKAFDYFKENYPHLSLSDCLRWYVTSKEGMHSSYDNEDAFIALNEYCWDKFKKELADLRKKNNKAIMTTVSLEDFNDNAPNKRT